MEDVVRRTMVGRLFFRSMRAQAARGRPFPAERIKPRVDAPLSCLPLRLVRCAHTSRLAQPVVYACQER